MPLQTIDEGIALPALLATEQLQGHSCIHNTRTSDSVSIFSHSTNSTASNLLGTGRVLGNVYSVIGRHLERTLGDIAHRVGFGPEAVYEKICILGRKDWIRDNETGGVIHAMQIALSLTTTPAVSFHIAATMLQVDRLLLVRLHPVFELINISHWS